MDNDPFGEWTDRPGVTALTSERLAALVESSINAADELLFTATPRTELNDIGRWQQLKDAAFFGQLRAIVAAHNRALPAHREFAGDEVGLAIGATPTTGAALVHLALSAAALPGLLDAGEAGILTERHLRALLAELDTVSLTVEQRQAVILIMLTRLEQHTPGELARLVRRLVLTVDRSAARRREQQATAGRRVSFRSDVDGQAVLQAAGPAARIAAIQARLRAELNASNAVGDERTVDARLFDLLDDLLTHGSVNDQPVPEYSVQVIVPFSTATGGDLELAEIPGYGPILPATARDLLDQASSLTQVAVDDHGSIIAVSPPITLDTPAPDPQGSTTTKAKTAAKTAPATKAGPLDQALRDLTRPPVDLRPLITSAYRPTDRIRRFVQARDRTCVFPGCHRRITDIDHRIPWPLGATDAHQLQCLCRHHHRAKQAVFTVELTPDGHYRWTTRGGWQFHRQRQGY